MPLLLSPDELRANMRLANPVTEGQRVLLPAGKVLNSADVDALRQNYPKLLVHIYDPMLDEMGIFADDSHDHEVARNARKQLARTLSGVRQKFAAQMSLRNMDFCGLQQAVVQVVQYIRDNPVAAAILSTHAGSGHYLTEHPANVFYLSLVLGNAVRGYVQKARADNPARYGFDTAPPVDLTPLALAALFQDISLWPLEELYRTGAPLTPTQRQRVRHHPTTSAKLLPQNTPELTARAVLMHHESYDGSGYPQGLYGEQIHLFGRILRICDAFDAATATRVYAQAKSTVRVLGEMTRGPYAEFYDGLLLKVFSHLVQPYPIGAKVRLNCRRYAVVVRYGESDPFRPVIVIAFDTDGSRLARDRIEGPYPLEQHPEIQIDSFRGEDVSDLYNPDPNESEPLVLTEFATLFESSYP